jgi:hypothetical protein
VKILLWSLALGILASMPLFLLTPGAMAQGKTAPESQPQITYGGGPGDSLKNAIVIKGAATNTAGIAAEYRYLEERWGRRNVDWRLLRQSLVHKGGRSYDFMQIKLQDGSQKEVYFDITEFFGKF